MSQRLLGTAAALSLGLFALQPLGAAAQTGTTADDCVPSATVTCPPGQPGAAPMTPGTETPGGADDSTAGVPVDPASQAGGAAGEPAAAPITPGTETPDGTDDSSSGVPADPASGAGGVEAGGGTPMVPGAPQPDGTDDSSGAVPQ